MTWAPDERFEAFAERMRDREGGGRYDAVNRFGYLGAYQFGMARLCDLGLAERIPGTAGYGNDAFRWVSGWSRERFLGDHAAQDSAFRRHVSWHLAHVEQRGLDCFVGEQLSALLGGALDPADDCVVSMSGIAAVCHLHGYGGFRALMMECKDLADANGTKASDYMREFGGIF